jgi:hypothetical protein
LKKEYDNIHNIHNNTNDNDEMTQDNIIHNIIDNNIHNIHDNIDNNVIDKIGLGGGEYSYADVPSDTLSRIKKERINDLTKKHDI